MNKTQKAQITNRLTKYFNVLIYVWLILTFLSIITEYFSSNEFKLIDFSEEIVISISLIAFITIGRKINDLLKMSVILHIFFLVGVYTTYESGFVGNGIYLVLGSIIGAFILIDIRYSIAYSIFFAIELVYLMYIKEFHNFEILNHSDSWNFQLIGIAALLSITILFIHVLKSYYINTLNERDKTLEVIKEKQNQIEYMAYYNQLTHLPNRKYFVELLNDQIDSPGYLYLLDVINFNQLNLVYGMKKADEILGQIGSFVKTEFKHGIVGYLNGNTFAIWLPECEKLIEKQPLLDKLNEALDFSNQIDFYIVQLMTSPMIEIGISLRIANHAVKRIKKENVNYQNYSKLNEEYLETYNRLTTIVEEAIEQKSFLVYFQEKYNINENKVVGLEALARLIVNGEFISPIQFIPIIEENNMILKFGWVIIENVFKLFKKIINQYGDDIVVSINVSSQQIASPTFVEVFTEMMKLYDITPKNIELELTESVLVGDLDSTKKMFVRLQEMGVKVAVDDFGTGYSSLKYISDLPIDVIKVDKTFIDQIVHNEKIKAITASIIKIAEVSGCDIVAEGVENLQQVEALSELGCYIIQGYYYSKPKEIQ